MTFGMEKGASPVAGSCNPLAGKPNVDAWGHAAMSRKSPPFSETVGTPVVVVSPSILRFLSCDQKKKILSFLIGPPKVYPKSFRRSLFFSQGVPAAKQPDFVNVLKVF